MSSPAQRTIATPDRSRPAAWNTQAGRWCLAFFLLVAAYGVYYAPYGVNETDGGFLTGLAWQVLQGKVLYRDVVYVRPPLPVWTHAVFLKAWGEAYAMLAERWLFYLKVAAYSLLAAALLEGPGARRWMLAAFGFVVSVHCFPPVAWHTIDGIFWAVLASWLGQRTHAAAWFAGGLCLAAAVLCKQSFYPLMGIWLLWLFVTRGRHVGANVRVATSIAGAVVAKLVFVGYLVQAGLLRNFLTLTTGATESGQALEHGLVDYLRIPAPLWLLTFGLLGPMAYVQWKKKFVAWMPWMWWGWLSALALSFAAQIWLHRDFTAPFGQTRLLFLVAAGYWLAGVVELRKSGHAPPHAHRSMPETDRWLHLGALLAISWCAAISWGYSLPILLATPWVYVAFEISRKITKSSAGWSRYTSLGPWLALVVLIAVFRWGYQWVYRDGPRNELRVPLGAEFPALRGLYTDARTAAEYAELRALFARYGPNATVLPAFPQANFLTRTRPPVPLDWVVRREMGPLGEAVAGTEFIEKQPVIFLQKAYAGRLDADPELAFVRRVRAEGQVVEDTPNFQVLRYER